MGKEQEAYEQQLAEMSKGMMDFVGEKLTEEEMTVMGKFAAKLKADMPQPGLKVGSEAPDFTLPDPFGSKVTLSDELKKGPVIVIFYRGIWCPVCSMHLRALQNLAPMLEETYKASIIAVTPQLQEMSKKQLEDMKLSYKLCSDLDYTVIKSYNLYFEMDSSLDALYKTMGLDVKATNGGDRLGLPIPGTFIINQSGKVAAMQADTDYMNRMKPDEIIAGLNQTQRLSTVQKSNLQLLSPVTVGGQTLTNRVAFAPMTRARCTAVDDPFDHTRHGVPNDLMVEHYVQRVSAGLLVTEAVYISEQAYAWRNAPGIITREQVAGWKKVTDAVHAKGGTIYIQLWHSGRQSHSSYHPKTGTISAPSAVGLSATKCKHINGEEVDAEVPTEMTKEDIDNTIQDFVKAARLSKEAGFDGVELHSANGYLIDIFFQSSTNKRTDEYDGTVANRCRFMREIIEAMISDGAFPANRLAFHLSPQGTFGEMGSKDNFETYTGIAEIMDPYGLAYLHIVDGLGFGYHGLSPVVTCADIRKVWKGPIIANCTLTRDVAEGMIRSGAADMCSFGRLYMSNPDIVERFANDWPLAPEAEYIHWWHSPGATGYNDFPTYDASK